MAALTDTFGVRYLPHVWGSAVGLAAGLQFVTALPPATASLRPPEPFFEIDHTSNHFRDELATRVPGIRCVPRQRPSARVQPAPDTDPARHQKRRFSSPSAPCFQGTPWETPDWLANWSRCSTHQR